ncbi:porin [Kaarinaea lacus]
MDNTQVALKRFTCLLLFLSGAVVAESHDSKKPDMAGHDVDSLPFKTTTEDGKEVLCVPVVLEVDTKEGLEPVEVTYECSPVDKTAPVPQNDQRGSAEAQTLKSELLDELGKKEKSIVEVPRDQLETAEETGEAPVSEVPEPELPVIPPKKIRPIKLYASLRANISITDDDVEISDGASRIGMFALKQANGMDYTGHIELGVNLFDNLEGLINGDTNTPQGKDVALSLRLLYANLEKGETGSTIGKNWSIYYRAAEVTDRFVVYGAKGTGVYNAGTDGGGSGTGRADNVLQIYSERYKLHWGLQAQYGTKIPGLDESVHYKWNYGAGIRYSWLSGFSLSTAYNHNTPEKITPEMLQRGIEGDGETLIVAANYGINRVYIGFTYTWLKNHVTDNLQQFFDARGWEFYSRYDFRSNIRLVAGYNYLKPEDENYSGLYNVRDLIIGAQYTFGKRDYSDMVYVEYLNSHGKLADGSPGEDIITIGGRYRLNW